MLAKRYSDFTPENLKEVYDKANLKSLSESKKRESGGSR